MRKLTYILFLLLFSTSYSQQNFDPNEITYQGDNIIIPESKLEEFLKYYPLLQNKTLVKQLGEINIDGYVSDPYTLNPIQDVEVVLYVYDGATLLDTLGPIYTNIDGYYSFTVVNVENSEVIENVGLIEYYGGKARITTNTDKKIKITIYDILGQKINSLNKDIDGVTDIDLGLKDNQPILTLIEIDGQTYTQIHIKQGSFYSVRSGKNIQPIILTNTKKINKSLTLGGVMDFTPPTNENHRYYSGVGDFYGDTKIDISLLPRINLENPIVDPEYTTIDTIKTLRDLWWYAVRFQGQPFVTVKMLFPIKLFIDSSNAPTGWKEEIRNVIQYYQDSLDIHPDSLIKENPSYTEPSFSNGFSAINIIYTDSTEIGQQYTTFDIVFSSTNNTIIGGWIKINVPKITNKEDAGMILARQIEVYTTQTIDRIKDIRFLGNTSYNNLGTTRRPNNDEKKWIKTGKFSKPFWFGGIFP